MTDFDAPGLPTAAQLPASLALFLLLLFGIRMVSNSSARYVVFACWLRFMLSAYHVYTFKHIAGPISGTALGSAGLFIFGLLLLPRRLLLSKVLVPVYLVLAVICISAFANKLLMDAFEPITKFGLLIVIALHTYRALEQGDQKKFIVALFISFAPLLVFQAMSVLFHVPKSTEGEGGEAYIGGFYHEAAFSTAILALFLVVALSRSIPSRLKVLIIPLCLLSIILANYRTAILAALPLLIYYALKLISRPVDRRLRGVIAILAGIGLIVAGGLSLMTLSRFQDLQTVVQSGTSLIKPPEDFGTADRQLLSGRTEIWSEYYYGWKSGNQLRHLVGFGPQSWEDIFKLYAHNTFVSYLFEYGLIGVAAIVVLFGYGLLTALRAKEERWKLVAAHLSFLILNLATMPLWLIEGNIVFGLLWGYTIHYSQSRAPIRIRGTVRPQLRAVSI